MAGGLDAGNHLHHGPRPNKAFDQDDCRMMRMLADFAAMGVRQQRQQKMLVEHASAAAAADMANDLAHKINNPLQSLTNILLFGG
jgi:nitrogen-specific signal transduction histidine kinase